MKIKDEVELWMARNISEYITATELAEAAIDHFVLQEYDLPEDLYDETHWVWESAFQAFERLNP